jgi:hypothetical protein
MGGSRKLFAGKGGFGVLGRYWTGRREGAELIMANDEKGIRGAMKTLLKESGCEETERRR